ncbi:MAG: hypothetical protein AAFO69_16005, partial [Bacteroidota bacterium]
FYSHRIGSAELLNSAGKKIDASTNAYNKDGTVNTGTFYPEKSSVAIYDTLVKMPHNKHFYYYPLMTQLSVDSLSIVDFRENIEK